MTLLDTRPGELISERATGSRSRHRLPRDQPHHRGRGGIGRAPAVAMVFHILAAFALMPVAGHPYDLAALTGTSGAWLRWGVPLFYHWKFGFDLTVLSVGSQGLSFVLEHLGMSGAAGLAVAWKMPLVLADLIVGVILVDLGRQLRCRRPSLMATLWLISPVPLWVSAAHGQIESLTVLAIVLALDMLLRRRPLLAGVVAGLGIGVEYLPALVALVVIFWLCVSVIERREVYWFAAGCAGALAFCFGPLLSSGIGRTSLLGGLAFSAAAASHPGHLPATSSPGSSLWAIFAVSPGRLWLVATLATSAALLIVLALRARGSDSTTDRRRAGVLAAGGLLLSVALFDPGALPQFSVLVLGGLCLVGLCVDLSPAVIILGPLLQLAGGLLFVYGGSFQSYWYDMWAATGTSGWPFPQSLVAANWAARLGPVVVATGLVLAPCRVLGAKSGPRLRILVTRSSIVGAALCMAFLATWSLQPAFWQGVGSQGPPTLADFTSLTAVQAGSVSATPGHALISFSPQEVLAARKATVLPSLNLTVTTRPFFARTRADIAKTGHDTVQALKIPGWVREKAQVHSLWVSALLGRPAWRSQARSPGGVPALAVKGRRISSSDITWVAPGWAVVTYDMPASMVSRRGRFTLGLQENHLGSGATEWNGSPHVRWVLVSLHSGTATLTINGIPWHGPVTLPNPTPSWWYQHVGDATIRVAQRNLHASVAVTRVAIGGKSGAVASGGLAWPSPGVLDHTIDGRQLYALGMVDVVALLGGAMVLGRWAARTTPQGQLGKELTRTAQSRGRHRAAGLPRAALRVAGVAK